MLLLLLAFSIGGIAADNPRAIWTSWFPLVLLLIVLVLGVVEARASEQKPRILLVALAIAGVVLLRTWVALRAPLTYLAIRENIDLYFACVLGLTFWIAVRGRPLPVYGVWIGGLLLIAFSRLPLSDRPAVFRPDMLPLVVSIPWGFMALSALMGRKRNRGAAAGSRAIPLPQSAESLQPIPSPGKVALAHLAALGAGVVLALLSRRYVLGLSMTDVSSSIQFDQSSRLLWARSVLFGWGRAGSLRLTEVVSQPVRVEAPEWLGLMGSLTAYGLLAAAAAVALAIAFLYVSIRRDGIEGRGVGSAPQLALLGAQALLGLIVIGGPQSSLGGLLLAGWAGLGLAGTSAKGAPLSTPRRVRFLRLRTIAWATSSAVAVALLIGGCVAALRPVWSKAIVADIRPMDLREPGLRARLDRAARLNPWDPRVELARAGWLREKLTRTSPWNENLFQEACDAYRRAQELDPYDSRIVMALAKIQDIADRPDQALATAQGALGRLPTSIDLIEWTYRYASARGRGDVALDMIDRGLALIPDSTTWWRRRVEFADWDRPGERPIGLPLTRIFGMLEPARDDSPPSSENERNSSPPD